MRKIPSYRQTYSFLLASRLSKEKNSTHRSSAAYNILHRKGMCWLSIPIHLHAGACKRKCQQLQYQTAFLGITVLKSML